MHWIQLPSLPFIVAYYVPVVVSPAKSMTFKKVANVHTYRKQQICLTEANNY